MINETNYLFTKERLSHIIKDAKKNGDDLYINNVYVAITDKYACTEQGLAFYIEEPFRFDRIATASIMLSDIKTVEVVSVERSESSSWSVGTD